MSYMILTAWLIFQFPCKFLALDSCSLYFKIYTSFVFVYLHNKFKTIYVLRERKKSVRVCVSFNYSERHERKK